MSFVCCSDTVVEVSLNGKDVLQGDDSTLNELGIVSGDLVIVSTPSDDNGAQNQVPVLLKGCQPSW
jgi:hypothetical protein